MTPHDIILSPSTTGELRAIFARLREAGTELAALPLERIVEVLGRLVPLWQRGTPWFQQACDLLENGPFSRAAVERAVESLGLGLQPALLLPALEQELGRSDLLDHWASDATGTGLVRGYPLGVVAQILAGNVFLGGVIALGQALLTRNAVLLKLSREDSGFTALFVRALRTVDEGVSRAVAVCRWDSGQEELNQVVREEADGVAIWGGAAAVAAYPSERCRGPVIHYGPRLGIGVVLNDIPVASVAQSLAWDVALWEQRACSSPRLLLVEGDRARVQSFARVLNIALTWVCHSLPPRALTLDEKAEVLSLRELAWWTEQAEVHAPVGRMTHTLLLAQALPEDVPLGFRTVLLVPLDNLDDLPRLLAPYRSVLQTAVLAAPAERWPPAVDVLVRSGLTQVAAPGASSARFLGLPHEGDFSLRRLVRLVGIDLGAGPLVRPERDPAHLTAVAAQLRREP